MSIWIPTSYMSPTTLSVRSQLIPSSNSKFLILGAKSSRMSNFCLSVKIVINLKSKPYSSTWVQVYSQFIKQSPRYQVIVISWKLRQSGLPRKTWFSTEARLSNLRPPLDFWHWNEFESCIDSWFRVPVGPQTKLGKD